MRRNERREGMKIGEKRKNERYQEEKEWRRNKRGGRRDGKGVG